MFRIANIRRALAVVATLVSLGAGVAPAIAAPDAVSGDRIELQRIRAFSLPPHGPGGPLRIVAQVGYQLQSAPRGVIEVFILESDTRPDQPRPSRTLEVAAGSDKIDVEIPYQSRPGDRTVSVVATLSQDEEDLLAWSKTRQMSVWPSPGRHEFDLGFAARQVGDNPGAADHFSAAIRLSPTLANYYSWRADTRVYLGQYKEAIADYSRALELAPMDRTGRIGRGVAYLWLGNWQAAVADLTAGIDQGGTDQKWTASAYRARGVANAALGKSAAAVADYRAYLALTPNAPDRAQIEEWIESLG